MKTVFLSAVAATLVGTALLPAGGCTTGGAANPCGTDPQDASGNCCPAALGVLDAKGSCCPTVGASATAVLDQNKVCQAKCDPKKCVAGNVCVANACHLLCTTEADCQPGTQACLAAKTDGGAAVQVCQYDGHYPTTDPDGGLNVQGKPCPFGFSQCQPTTTPKNTDFTACPNGLECDKFACNGNPSDCKPNAAACALVPATGPNAPPCNIGTCAKDGNSCTVTTCDASQCGAFTCRSHGEGDAYAYCARYDCAADADCGPGYFCAIHADPHKICGDTCDTTTNKCKAKSNVPCALDSDCEKGGGAHCGGGTKDPCVELKNAMGTTYSEGPICLMRAICLRRDECGPCASDVDCTAGNGDVCAPAGPPMTNACAHFCAADANCRKDQKCAPAGSTCAATPHFPCATPADCPTPNDTCVPRSACVPRSGGCHAENATPTKFCYTCVNDLDCGDATTHWACEGSGGGELACIDLSFPNKCTTDNDCPTSPGGAHGRCLDDSDGVMMGDSAYHRCYFPRKPLSQGENQGYSCYP